MNSFKKIAIGFGLVSIITLQGLQASKPKECQSEADKVSGCVEIEEWQERMSYGSIETLYKNGKKESIKDYRNGELEFETLYKYTKEGYTEYYYGYGTLLGVTPYKNGKEDGIEKEYYESGKLKLEGSYKDCGRDGVMKIYYESGNVKNELTASEDGQYDDKFYTEDGNLLGVVRYNGKAIESVKCAKKKLSDKEAKGIREKFIQLKLRQQDDEHEFIAKHCK